MVQTAMDILKMFNYATTAYTQSDEITLLCPKNTLEKLEIPYGGNVVKMSSILAGYCSARFNANCMKYASEWPKTKEEYLKTCHENQTQTSYNPDKVQSRLFEGKAHFDCRVFNVDNNSELLNNVKHRSNYDCQRNSKASFGRAFFNPKQLLGLRAGQIIKKVKDEKNVDWNHCPDAYRYGSFVKNERFEKTSTDPKTDDQIMCVRTKQTAYSFELENFDSKNIELITQKTWNDVFGNNIIDQSKITKLNL